MFYQILVALKIIIKHNFNCSTFWLSVKVFHPCIYQIVDLFFILKTNKVQEFYLTFKTNKSRQIIGNCFYVKHGLVCIYLQYFDTT